jgi:hypothetical protein
MTSEKIPEKIERLSKSIPGDWERLVYQRYKNRCANCGNPERIRVVMVVPPEAGGQPIDSNGVLLCRSCEMATDAVKKGKTASDQRLVNFWVSRKFFDTLHSNLTGYRADRSGFRSMGALIRYMIAKYVEDESRFDDLSLFQDEGADAKINVWVGKDQYGVFKALLDKRGMTVTDAIKGLILAYFSEAEPLIVNDEVSGVLKE